MSNTNLFRAAHTMTRGLVHMEGGDYRATFGLALRYLRDGGTVADALTAARIRRDARNRAAKHATEIATVRASIAANLSGAAADAAHAIVDGLVDGWDHGTAARLRAPFRVLVKGGTEADARAKL